MTIEAAANWISEKFRKHDESARTWTRSLRMGALPILAVILLGAGPARQAWAWGRMAHRASTRLAEMRLTPRTRLLVRELLERGESLADASTWADENSRSIPGSAAWHYVNVPITAASYSPRDCRDNCVVSRFEEFRRTLADSHAPKRRRQMALRYVVHLLEDAHQPMHVGDHRDRGGNTLQLQFFHDDYTNLHQVWDSGLLRNGYRNERDLVDDLVALARKPETNEWTKGDIEDWVNESLEAAHQAYRIPGSNDMLRTGMRLGREYEDANLPLAVKRLSQAGIRLSEVLNECLDPRPNNAIPAPHLSRQKQPLREPAPPAPGIR